MGEPRKQPVILSGSEVAQVLAAIKGRAPAVALTAAYGTGRASASRAGCASGTSTAGAG